jgi:multicomponent Na+:H+ antiporter subunit F
MADWYFWLAVIILLTVIGALPRVFKGPTRADSMLSAQLWGTASVAILLLLANALEKEFLYDVALVFALLAAVSTVAFVQLAWHHPAKKKNDVES